MDKTETREIVTQKIEIREDDNGNRTLIGYAVKWEKKSVVMGYYRKFREQFKNGAFTETLQNDDQRFYGLMIHLKCWEEQRIIRYV